jgi:hypothetical protein
VKYLCISGGLLALFAGGSCDRRDTYSDEENSKEITGLLHRMDASLGKLPDNLFQVPGYEFHANAAPSLPQVDRHALSQVGWKIDRFIADLREMKPAVGAVPSQDPVFLQLRRVLHGPSAFLSLKAADALVLLGGRDEPLRGRLAEIIRWDQQNSSRATSGDRGRWLTARALEIGREAGWRFPVDFAPALTIQPEGDGSISDPALVRRFGNSRFGSGRPLWLDGAGRLLVTRRGDDLLTWDMRTGERLGRFETPDRIIPAYPGHALVYGSAIGSGREAGVIRLIRIPDGEETGRLRYLDLERGDDDDKPADLDLVGPELSASVTADGRTMLLSAGGSAWLVRDGFKEIQRLALPMDGHDPRRVMDAVVSPDGQHGYVVDTRYSYGGGTKEKPQTTSLYVIDLAKGEIQGQRVLDDRGFLPRGRWAITGDGRHVAALAASSRVRVWSLPDLVETEAVPLENRAGASNLLSCPQRPSQLILAGQGMELIDPATCSRQELPATTTGFVPGVGDSQRYTLGEGTFVREDRGRVHAYIDGEEVGVWGEPTVRFIGLTTVSGRTALCGSFGGDQVRCLALESGESIAEFELPDLPESGLAGCAARSAPVIAIRTEGGSILWNPESGVGEQVDIELWACSDDGFRFVSAAGIWDRRGKPRVVRKFSSGSLPRDFLGKFYNADTAFQLHSRFVGSSRVILSSGRVEDAIPYLTTDARLLPQTDEDRRNFHVMDGSSLYVVAKDGWQRHGVHEHAKHISIDPSARYFVYSVSSDIYVHSIDRQQAIARMEAHLGYEDYVHSDPLVLLEFTPDGKLLSAGDDGQAFLWDFERLVGRAENALRKGSVGSN